MQQQAVQCASQYHDDITNYRVYGVYKHNQRLSGHEWSFYTVCCQCRRRTICICCGFVWLYFVIFCVTAFYQLSIEEEKSQYIGSGAVGSVRLLNSQDGAAMPFYPQLTWRLRKLPDCQKLILSERELPIVALSSFPGSGNTWLRHLVQQISGIYTGSVYKDQGLRKHGFPAEGIQNTSVIAIKTHELGEEKRQVFDKAILLVRDPFDAMLAEFNRQFGGHIGHASTERFHQDHVWSSFVKRNTEGWYNFHTDWLKFQKDMLIVFYSDLKTNLRDQVQRIAEFLNVTMSPEILACSLKNSRGLFKRESYVLPFEPYNEEMVYAINRYKQVIMQKLREREQQNENKAV